MHEAKHAKFEPAVDTGPSAVLADCSCGLVMITPTECTGRRDWNPECTVHGVKAKVAAGIWPEEVGQLWYQARATQPI